MGPSVDRQEEEAEQILEVWYTVHFTLIFAEKFNWIRSIGNEPRKSTLLCRIMGKIAKEGILSLRDYGTEFY